ncbi:MAG: hypothetical protein BWY67_01772 [Bacteroidetes bacterium ADurb.Bin397]|nr:MAG: hypothetical protein BWY67_01772 [Bacteroidetes bacterium ADurb.Bin397]
MKNEVTVDSDGSDVICVTRIITIRTYYSVFFLWISDSCFNHIISILCTVGISIVCILCENSSCCGINFQSINIKISEIRICSTNHQQCIFGCSVHVNHFSGEINGRSFESIPVSPCERSICIYLNNKNIFICAAYFHSSGNVISIGSYNH